MRAAFRDSMMVIIAAIIAGWYLRIGMERWPVWQPIISMAALFVCAFLSARLDRAVTRAECSKPHLDGVEFTCLRPHQGEDGTDG